MSRRSRTARQRDRQLSLAQISDEAIDPAYALAEVTGAWLGSRPRPYTGDDLLAIIAATNANIEIWRSAFAGILNSREMRAFERSLLGHDDRRMFAIADQVAAG